MSSDDIKNYWMHIGKSSRGYAVGGEHGAETRVTAGSKGIGRFALARLGDNISLRSFKNNNPGIEWDTDWNGSTLTEVAHRHEQGTYIEIKSLRDKWTIKSFKKLMEYLSISYKGSSMQIRLSYEEASFDVNWAYENPALGQTHVSELHLEYDASSQIMRYKIISDEFLPEAQKYCAGFSIYGSSGEIDMKDEYATQKEFEYDEQTWNSLLNEIGSFKAVLFFSLNNINTDDADKFLYKYKKLNSRYSNGIALYRNAFSISSYEGSKDWLDLSARARKSPAAATHPTGSWRVRANQLSGYILIDKQRNKAISDLSNRQGVEENDSFHVFKAVIQSGLKEFERYRQEIIRAVNAKNKLPEITKSAIQKFTKTGYKNNSSYNADDWRALKEEINALSKSHEKVRAHLKEIDEEHRYDTRILNVFATIGLKSLAKSHEFKTSRNSLSNFYELTIQALKSYGMWEKLNSAEFTRYSHNNVPELLERAKESSKMVIGYLDSILEQTEKRRFETTQCELNACLQDIIKEWEASYSLIEIKTNVNDRVVCHIPEDVVSVIFDNLILNSIQQFKLHRNRPLLQIEISAKENDTSLEVVYKDNGPGLHKKYRNNPRQILEVHETTRASGHGLGMWIVNSSIKNYGGEITSIHGEKGFKIRMEIEQSR